MIVSFYSYKGGVGRTQLLVNIASCLCFEYKQKILLIDWDLEAPGLPFFFENKDSDKEGLLDLLTDYLDFVKETRVDENNIPCFNENYIQNCVKTENSGLIDLVSTGKASTYSQKLYSFNWDDFYGVYDGKNYIEWLKEGLKERYDYVFIDSRTGISNYSGIPNIQMPDINVMVVAPTLQNFEGSFRIAQSIGKSDYVLKGYRSPIIIPILSRVDPFIIAKVDEWTSKFKIEFQDLYTSLFNILGEFGEKYLANDTFINDTLIEYNSELSFGENTLFPIGREKESIVVGFTQKIRNIAEIIENIKNPIILDDSNNSNLTYKINLAGKIYFNKRVYSIDKDIKECILFMRIEATNTANSYTLNIGLKSKNSIFNTIGTSGENLLKEKIPLVIPQALLDNLAEFQIFRRTNGIYNPNKNSFEQIENDLAQQIFQACFSGTIGNICADFIGLLEEQRIEELLLVISSDIDTIINLPFEIVLPLFFPPKLGEIKKSLTKANFGLVRTKIASLEALNLQGEHATAAPLKMLFITALPENLDERSKMMQIEEEQTRLIRSIGALEATGDKKPKIVIEFLENASLFELDKALHARQHDIVHISGYGAYHTAQNKGVLYFENEEGNEEQVSGAALGETIRQHSCVKLLVMCISETAIAGIEGGISEQATAYGIPSIVAMRFALTDEGAKVFITELYTQLAKGMSLTQALAYAREALLKDVIQRREQSPQLLHIAEWFTPVVFQNQSLGVLIDKTIYDDALLKNFYPPSSFLKTRQSRLIGEGFIGRKRYLIQLRQAFRAGRHVCLYGLGGLGKTTLAEAFAHNYDNHSYTTLIFRKDHQINEAHILRTLTKRFHKINPELAKQVQQTIDDPQIEVLDKLQLLIDNYLQGRKTILIFDNVEDVQTDDRGIYQQSIGSESLSAFLRHLCTNTPPNCHVLFTTRYKIANLADVLEHLALDKLGYAEQYRLLNYSEILRAIPLKERDEVYKRLDGHPRSYEYLEVLLKKDKTFNWKKVSQAESEVFENLLLAKVYERLTAREKAIFQNVSVFISRSPLAALAAVSKEVDVDLLPILQALQDWSLCFLEKDGRFEVHRLTREWMVKQVIDPVKLKEGVLQAGEYFEAQSTLDDLILAKNYFELAEAWAQYATTSFNIQNHYQLIGLYQQAFELNQTVLEKNIDAKTNAEALNYNGMMSIIVGDYDLALSYLEQSLTIQQQIGDRQGEGATLNNISQIYDTKGDYDTALDYLKESLVIRQQIGDRKGEGATLNNLATTAHAKGDYETALLYLEQSLAIQKQIDDRKGEGATLNNLATTTHAKGDYDTALRYLEQSLTIKQEIGDRFGEGVTLNNIGQIYDAKGNYDSALLYLEQSLVIRQQIGDRKGEGATLNNISQICAAKGDYDTALSYLEQSLAIQQQIGDRQGEGATLNNLATTAHAKGDYDIALRYLEQSLAIQQQIGDRKSEGNSLNNISQIHFVKGDYDTALHYLEQSLTIAQQIGDRKGESVTLNNISRIYDTQGDYDTALPYLEQSLAIQQQLGDRKGEGATLNNISRIFDAKCDYDTALSYLEQSLAIQQQIGDLQGEGATLNNMGQIYSAKGKFEIAVPFLEQSLAITQQIGDLNGMATALHNMGCISFDRNDFEGSIPYFVQAYQIFLQLESPNVKSPERYLGAIIERIGEMKFQEILSEME